MYKVIVLCDDEMLNYFNLPEQTAQAHCVEFTAEIVSDGSYKHIIESKPDILILSRNMFILYENLIAFNSEINCIIVCDGFGEELLADVPPRCTIFDVRDNKNIVLQINEMINGIKAVRAKENFAKMVIREADKLKPIIKEQFFKDFILGMGNTDEILKIYCDTFNISVNQKVHMFIFRPEQEITYDDYFFLKNIIESHIGTENIIGSTIVQNHILVVSGISNSVKIGCILKKLEKEFDKYYSYGITTVYGGLSTIREMPRMYTKLNKVLDYCFYTGDGAVVSADEFDFEDGNVTFRPDYCAIESAVKSADEEKTHLLMHSFFKEIEMVKPEPAVAKTYCLELYVCIIRCCDVDKIDKYMKGIVELQELKTLCEIKEYTMRTADEILFSNSPQQTKKHSVLIANTMNVIEENIGNEQLSLRWIAGSILYTNVDYLGKLFKRETGENFSHYVMKKRMELAKKLISEGKKERIYEVAEKVGYGSNSQYFSQVFKKYTGVSPLEYKEYAVKINSNPA